jgi:hypothetical protein
MNLALLKKTPRPLFNRIDMKWNGEWRWVKLLHIRTRTSLLAPSVYRFSAMYGFTAIVSHRIKHFFHRVSYSDRRFFRSGVYFHFNPLSLTAGLSTQFCKSGGVGGAHVFCIVEF